MKNKVKIISCYYGSLPKWLDLWILSASFNREFDFLIVGDDPCPKKLLNSDSFDFSNISYKMISFDDLKKTINSVVGFNVTIDTPYKLCDLKPVYGLIFQHELIGYDFWGHCDLDIIWGDLSKSITDDILDNNDRIGHFGHLCLYRNTPKMNNLFRAPGSIYPYTTVFRDSTNYGFDEMTGLNMIAKHESINEYYTLPIADAHWLLDRVSVCPGSPISEIYCWKNGQVLRIFGNDTIYTQEFIYLHFQKKSPVFSGDLIAHANGFYIHSDTFIPRLSSKFSLDEIVNYTEQKTPLSDKICIIKGHFTRALDLLFKKSVHEKIIQLKKGIRYFIFHCHNL